MRTNRNMKATTVTVITNNIPIIWANIVTL